MFWLENCFIVIAFFAYSLLLVPVAYLLNFITIIQSVGVQEAATEEGEKKEKLSVSDRIKKRCKSMRKVIQYLAMWLFAGIFFCIFIAGKDVYNLCRLLMMLRGCQEEEVEEDEIDENIQVNIYEEVRIVVIEKYIEIRDGLIRKGN